MACAEEQQTSSILDRVESPADLRELTHEECAQLATEMRSFIVDAVSVTGGHLGSNLGAVELTIALHRVFDSPRDYFLFDTGHQTYPHKIITGRRDGFTALRQEGGLSGYPSREESEHDHIENSHASTALSYAHGLAKSLELSGQEDERRVIVLVGDGALTGGLSYEALNNIGHSGARVLIVLNDNGRSYAPTVSRLSESLTQLRLSPTYTGLRDQLARVVKEVPVIGGLAQSSYRGLSAAVREIVEPPVFFEALGVRYTGPVDGHDVSGLEQALRRAADWEGPIVLHVLTRKGKGYAPAEQDEVQCLHDLKVVPPSSAALAAPGAATDQGAVRPARVSTGASYTEAFGAAVLRAARRDEKVVAMTAAMPGPTGLLALQAAFPDRYIDVGIAEAHAVTAAAGLAMGGMKPVVAIYSTFFSRAFDQANLDVGLHRLPVVFCLDRAGVTGDDGASHHGLFDLVLSLSIPGMQVFCPSSTDELDPMLATALASGLPCVIRYPKTPSTPALGPEVEPYAARRLTDGDGECVLIGVGKLASTALGATEMLAEDGFAITCFDPRVIRPADEAMLEEAAAADVVVTVEDGLAAGGAGAYLCHEISARARRSGRPVPAQLVLGMPTAFVPQAKPDSILARAGLDVRGVATAVREVIAHSRSTRRSHHEREASLVSRSVLARSSGEQ